MRLLSDDRKCPELDGNSFASLPVRLKYKQISLNICISAKFWHVCWLAYGIAQLGHLTDLKFSAHNGWEILANQEAPSCV